MTVARWATVIVFVEGMALGLALGLVVMGFTAVAAYRRGFELAEGRRPQWRAELVARRAALRNAAAAPLRKAG